MSDGDKNAKLADVLGKKINILKNDIDELRKLPNQIHDILERFDMMNVKLTAEIKSISTRLESLVDKTEAMAARLDTFHQRVTHIDEQLKQ